MEWSVSFTAHFGELPDEDRIEAVVDELAEYHGAVTWDPEGDVGARFTIEANSVNAALAAGARVFERALSHAITWAGAKVIEASAQEWEHFVRDLEGPNFPELVGVTEVAEILGVSKQRVSNLARMEHFPAPMFTLAAGPIWARPAIERFVERWNRKPGRPPSPKSAGGIMAGSVRPAIEGSKVPHDKRPAPHRGRGIRARRGR